jgi:class 3 adenylate cyclase
LELATELFRRTGRAIDAAGGKLIKPIGDAGLFVFPEKNPDRIVDALREMKRDCDRWLAEMGYPDSMVVRARLGPVARGQVGAPGDERFDIYGLAVNRAASMRGQKFTLGAELVSCLKPSTRRDLDEFSDDEFIAAD